MTAADRLVSLLNARRVGDGRFIARCPAHDDKSPSLSIKAEPDRVLIRCHAGCSVESIVAELRLTVADLFDNVRPKSNGNVISLTHDELQRRALRGLEIWAGERRAVVCSTLREIEASITMYVKLLPDVERMTEESWEVLQRLYFLRNDCEYELAVLNSRNTAAKLEIWRSCR